MAIQIRRGTDSEWESNKSNIVAGEPAVAMDSERMFVGTGSGTYMELANLDVLADAFDSSAAYAVGDYCTYQGKLYKFTSAHSGAWDASDVDEVTVIEELELKADKTETYTKTQVDSIVEDAIAEAVKESEYSNFEMKSVSGDFIHITDGAGLIPVKDLKIGIDAVQEGTGDPSPENIRPISGWTGAKVNVTGKNLFNKNEITEHSQFNSQGEVQTYPSYNYAVSDYIKVYPNTEYYFKNVRNSISGYAVMWYDEHKAFITSATIYEASGTSASASATSPATAKFVRVCVPNGNINDSAVNYPSSFQDYEPFGTTYSVTWETEAGTVYGGTLDVTTGELTITFVSTDLTQNMNVGDIGGIYVYYKELSPLPKVVSNAEPANVIAEAYTKIRYNGVTGSIGTIAIRTNNYIYVNTGGRDISPTGKAIYELVTPQTYQLTPTEVLTLLGENNIFADTGVVEELIYRISNQ